MKLNKPLIIVLFLSLIPTLVGLFFIFISSKEIMIETDSERMKPVEEEKPLVETEIKIRSQKTLANPPEVVKAIYLTSGSAGSENRINYLIDIASTTEINAVVIDIKDFSGYLAYESSVPEVKKYRAENIKIADIDSLIKKLHEKEIYVIARIVVFQDPIFAGSRPDLAVHSQAKLASSTSQTPSEETLWLDNYGLGWIDPAAKESWDYNLAIAKEAVGLGFDEINLDYLRFPTDGDLKDIYFPVWDGKTPKNSVLKEFYKYIRQELPETKISIDFFGLSTVNFDDLGIGQIIEDAFEYFDYVSPMAYPSHYSPGFLGFENPNEHPYEVVKYSMENALARLRLYRESKLTRSTMLTEYTTPTTSTALRPWLQHFNLGVEYDREKIWVQIQAVKEVLGENFSGFMLWSPTNIYLKEAFEVL